MRLGVFLLVLSFGIPVRPVAAQSLERTISLTDGDPTTFDQPFGLALDPDGRTAYVALCGELPPFPLPPAPWFPTWNNDKVQKIDLLTGATLAQASVGHFPEDLAITLDPAGQTRHVYVSNSSSGTVTCLTAGLQVVATISLTPCLGGNYGTVFPYGIIVSPDGSQVLVQGTGCGVTDVIDADPQSPTFNQITSSFTVPDQFGRPSWLTPTRLVVPFTRYIYNPVLGFSDGSITGVTVVDVTQPSQQTEWALTTFTQFSYPSITDLGVLPSGGLVVPVGWDLTPRVLEVDPMTGTITRTLDFGIQTGLGLHGIAVSPGGETAAIVVVDRGQLVLVDLASFSTLSITPTSPTPLALTPNDVIYTPDSSRLAITLQGGMGVQVWSGLPSFDLILGVDAAPPVGGTADLGIMGAESGQRVAIFISSGPGPIQAGPHTVFLDPDFILFADLVADVSGRAGLTVIIPAVPALVGSTWFLQAGTTDLSGGLRLSNGAATTLQ
jgi:DNA-binding beta-propeller fold protein YncE